MSAAGRALVLGREQMAQGRFLELRRLKYRDVAGQVRSWESAGRVKGQNAVFVIARLMPGRRLVLVRQYRPPVDCEALEFPAGLIDAGEGVEEAAVRELWEETGYRGVVKRVLPFGTSSAGMTDECAAGVVVEVASAEYSAPPEAHPDEGERIQVVVVSEGGLLAWLEGEASRGVAVDAKLLAYAVALEERG